MEEKQTLDELKQAQEEPAAEAPVWDEAVPAEETAADSAEPTKTEEAPEKKETPADGQKPMSKKKKILNAILLGVQIALVVVALIITLVVLINPKSDDVSSAGLKLLPVLSGSMEGSWTDEEGNTYEGFKAGALVIAKNPTDKENLQVGDIVTFSGVVMGKESLITHRIVEVHHEEGFMYYRTKGDANTLVDEEIKHPNDIKAVYVTHINGLGWALNWIRDGYHFIFIIIIPLGVLLLYNIYLVAQIVVEGKMKKARAAAAESAKQQALASIDEEEIKRKAIEEYLKSQAAAAQKPDGSGEGENE